ncbi:MAG: c-type cytochrome [Candidatus Binatia bacterium]
MRRRGAILGIAAAVLVGASVLSGCGGDERTQAQLVAEGRRLFESSCAACHGIDLRGTDGWPPLLDPIYAPNHHPDQAFYNAVENGVQPHHWNFGPMPPQLRFSEADVEAIVAYVRSRQLEAGITGDPSHGPQP